MRTKLCKGKWGCNKILPTTEFQEDKRYKDGVNWICKNCLKIYTKQHPQWKTSGKKAKKKYLDTLNGRSHHSCYQLKARCKKNNIEFNLTPEWFYERLQNNCEISNLPFNLIRSGKKGCRTPFGPSIDRIDNTKGYTKNNCRMVLMGVNGLKNTGSDNDLYKIAEAVYKNRKI